MDIETCVTLSYLFKTKKNIFFHFSDPFLAIFSTLPSTQTIKVSGLISFSLSWPWQIGQRTCISTLYLFSKAFSRGGGSAKKAIHRFPDFIGLALINCFTSCILDNYSTVLFLLKNN